MMTLVFEEGVAQVVHMAVANIFNAEIVNGDGEHDGAPLVLPEARSGGALAVARNVEVYLEELVAKNSGLQKSIDAATNFELDPAIADTVGEVIF